MAFRGGSSVVEQRVHPAEGGSIPTSPLQLRKKDWSVGGVDQRVAENLVIRHHYAKGASNTATYLHGLYPTGWLWYNECVGVAWWIPPTMTAARWWAPENPEGVLVLSRLVIEPEVPPNACSFLISKSLRMIDRARWPVLVTYADSWRGHTGVIYRAVGAEYCGETKPQPVYTVNGRMAARKATRTRTHTEMLALGAKLEGRFSKSRFRFK